MKEDSKAYLTQARKLPFGVRLLVAVVLLSWSTSFAYSAEVQIPGQSARSAAELVRQGKLLRAEIDARFYELKSSDTLHAGADVTSIVTKYVPPGIPFDDAKQILQAAGLGAGGLTPDGHLFFRVLIGGWFFKDTTFAVDLTPRAPGDFSVVQTVTGSLLVNYI
ncbi:MAG TPA: hypothetical protein VKG05_05695 [Steroidobacteraceae bacterium]|nr:hypothetical protein [Steroidobacteraceae bacterium]